MIIFKEICQNVDFVHGCKKKLFYQVENLIICSILGNSIIDCTDGSDEGVTCSKLKMSRF